MPVQACPRRRAWTTNANTSSFASRIPTTTEPTNDGVIDLAVGGQGSVRKRVMLWPFGLGADNDAASMRVIGWSRALDTASALTLWVPTILIEVACTFSAAVGIAGAVVLNTERFADTITVVAARQRTLTDTDSGGAASRGTVEIFSPTNDLVGFLIVPLLGSEKVELCFDQTTNTPTCNALYAFLDD